MKKIVLFILFITAACFANAQQYKQAIGIRGGITSGFEYRAFANEVVSYKALLSTRQRGIQLTGMKEFHHPGMFDFSNNLSFIYGFGAHVGFESWNAYDPDRNPLGPYHFEKRTGPVVGLDGLIATEYNFMDIPLSVGLEIKPYFNLFGKNFFQLRPADMAFTIKYTF